MNYQVKEKNKLFPEIINKYGKLVSSIANRVLYNDEDKKDAMQDAWLEVIKSLNTFRGDSKLSTWIYSIAYRAILRYSKKEKKYSEKSYDIFFNQKEILEIPVAAGKEEWIRDTCDNCITAFLHCLSPEDRLSFIFREIAKVSFSEISNVMDKDERAVRK